MLVPVLIVILMAAVSPFSLVMATTGRGSSRVSLQPMNSYPTPSTPIPSQVNCYIKVPVRIVRRGGRCIQLGDGPTPFYGCQAGEYLKPDESCERILQGTDTTASHANSMGNNDISNRRRNRRNRRGRRRGRGPE